MCTLDGLVDLFNLGAVKPVAFMQCGMGAVSAKPTDIVGHFDLSAFPKICECPHQWWRTPGTGKWRWGPHPEIRGKLLQVKQAEWTDDM